MEDKKKKFDLKLFVVFIFLALLIFGAIFCFYHNDKSKYKDNYNESNINIVESDINFNTSWSINSDGNLVGENICSSIDGLGYVINFNMASILPNTLYAFKCYGFVPGTVNYGVKLFINGNAFLTIAEDGSYNTSIDNGFHFTTPSSGFPSTISSIYVRVQFNNYVSRIGRCMINEGNDYLPWEPYGVWYSQSNYNQYGQDQYDLGYNAGYDDGIRSVSAFSSWENINIELKDFNNNLSQIFSINDYLPGANLNKFAFNNISLLGTMNYAESIIDTWYPNNSYYYPQMSFLFNSSNYPKLINFNGLTFDGSYSSILTSWVMLDDGTQVGLDVTQFSQNITLTINGSYDLTSNVVSFVIEAYNSTLRTQDDLLRELFGSIYVYNITDASNSKSYQSGYSAGYKVGLATVDSNSENYLAGYDKGLSDANDLVVQNNASYDAGYDFANEIVTVDSASYIAGKNKGYDDGYLAGQRTNAPLRATVFAIADTPIRVFKQIFDFDVLGINLAGIVLSIMSLFVVIWIVRKVK